MVFYNGPKCGASAPDHMHLQAGTGCELPLQANWATLSKQLNVVCELAGGDCLGTVDGFCCPLFAIVSKSRENNEKLFQLLYKVLLIREDEPEPMMNIVSWRDGDNYIFVIIPREKHRPDCYFAVGEEQILVSPGALDMSGLVITPRLEDYQKLSATDAEGIIAECGISRHNMQQIVDKLKSEVVGISSVQSVFHQQQPNVSVGIVGAHRIEFTFHSPYLVNEQMVVGKQEVTLAGGMILWNGKIYEQLSFSPQQDSASFSLEDVTIGINFHWERKEVQTFLGILRFTVDGDRIWAINVLPVEQYLESVISSEMSATSSLELLKAHAVISRSWLLAQMEKRNRANDETEKVSSCTRDDEQLIRWYDREDHTLFDVCADDHCQRYQGITKETSPHVKEAIRQTSGQVLISKGEICDARFSKSCGGVMEEFQYCWEDTPKDYLVALADTANEHVFPDLRIEKEADRWIRTTPESFCNTHDKHVLSQVLNDYDQETTDFFRWHVDYTQQELSALILKKTQIDFGQILDLQAVERGKSGRICKLRIVGTKRIFTIGKELEIRRALSESHLYSSAFVVDRLDMDANGVPRQFRLIGAGWGHGVGLCQIGAAVMGEQGYLYNQILLHYYPGASVCSLY
uniref:SpoIID/LytB domain-containing protein n=1 Tax=Prevotella sp. GTC17253 TaxID=3236793 RepID=A0AB33IV70_9BACT